jgi:molecular chaperone GrpE
MLDDKKENKDDVVIEPDENLDDSVVAEEAAGETIKKLRDKLKACEKEKADYLAGWQRARADYANFKRETDDAKKLMSRFANERLFDDVIPVLDSFDMAFGNKKVWESVDKNWRTGVEYIYSQLVKALENHGLIQYTPAVGEKMDAAKHEPAGTVPTDDEKKDHTIAEVIKKGYMIDAQVFRPAQVKAYEVRIENGEQRTEKKE